MFTVLDATLPYRKKPEAFLKPLMRQVDEDPTLIIQDHSGDSESVPILRGFLSKCYLSYSDMTAGSILENSRNGLYRIQKNMMEYELLWSN